MVQKKLLMVAFSIHSLMLFFVYRKAAFCSKNCENTHKCSQKKKKKSTTRKDDHGMLEVDDGSDDSSTPEFKGQQNFVKSAKRDDNGRAGLPRMGFFYDDDDRDDSSISSSDIKEPRNVAVAGNRKEMASSHQTQLKKQESRSSHVGHSNEDFAVAAAKSTALQKPPDSQKKEPEEHQRRPSDAKKQESVAAPQKKNPYGNPVGAFVKPKKEAVKDKAKPYGNLAGAFVTKPKAKNSSQAKSKSNVSGNLSGGCTVPSPQKAKLGSPKNISKPTRPGRTSLGETVDMGELAAAMRTDIVLHFDPRGVPDTVTAPVERLMGVYEPIQLNKLGFPVFSLNGEKTHELFQRLSACSGDSRRRLAEERGIHVGIHFDKWYHDRPYTIWMSDRPGSDIVWQVFDIGKMMHGVAGQVSPGLFSSGFFREREMEFWTDENSLFMRHSAAFTEWDARFVASDNVTYMAPLDVAMTPVAMFNRAIDLAEMPLGSPQPPLKASDFSFWNRPLVLHANCHQSHFAKESLDPWMGVYLPGSSRIYDGYPIWRLSRRRSNALAAVANEGVKMSLVALGIGLNHSSDDTPALLYLHHHTLHVSSLESFENNPKRNFVLRNKMAPSNEARLLTESDALFQLGEAAFAKWFFKTGSQWIEVSVAVTPETFYESAINLADVELAVAQEISEKGMDESNERVASSGPNNRKRKKNKKKKKRASRPEDDPPVGNQTAEGESEMKAPGASCELARDGHGDDQFSAGSNIPHEGNPETVVLPAHTNVTSVIGAEKSEASASVEEIARQQGQILARAFGLEESPPSTETPMADGLDRPAPSRVLRDFFNASEAEPSFLHTDEILASQIFESSLKADSAVVLETTKQWLRSNADALLMKCIERDWKLFVVSMLQTGVAVSASALCDAFNKLPKCNDEFNNHIAKSVLAIQLSSESDFKPLLAAVNKRVGKQTRKIFYAVLKKGEAEMLEAKQAQSRAQETSKQSDDGHVIAEARTTRDENGESSQPMVVPDGELAAPSSAIEEMKSKIMLSLKWYRDQLDQYRNNTATPDDDTNIKSEALHGDADSDSLRRTFTNFGLPGSCQEGQQLSSKDVAVEMAKCASLPEDQQDVVINMIENSLDLNDWENSEEWTVEMTEQAHRWFQRHAKKNHYLCDRVLRRLKILSTGRWTYTLCKPLRTRHSSARLYESKLDKACRIIWQVALAFSPRRSSANFSCCEQVIRVWDIVLDHDNLARSIDMAIDRIEKSLVRGQESLLYSELEGYYDASIDYNLSQDSSSQRLPRVFAMRQLIERRDGVDAAQDLAPRKNIFYQPASDDPMQFTLLKFYELDAGAIKILLDRQNEDHELPFTPGPKEHEIIHYNPEPQRSILLMGRSGTGKTTCLVFRMWAQYMAYEAAGASSLKPRQLFVTKNAVLRNEVEKSFRNMGLVWRQKSAENSLEAGRAGTVVVSDSECAKQVTSPLFLTSSEWLDILDASLPGNRFFTEREIDERIGSRNDADDAVKREIEAMFAEEEDPVSLKSRETVRQEMTFSLFFRKWRNINSRIQSEVDPALVWLEIKSYIKGSVSALQIDKADRSTPKNRFLNLEEYLGLPRKVSRLDQTQRRAVYQLYKVYEKVKREGNHYDEMDLVFNLAGRVSLFNGERDEANPASLLPIDSLYVDEVQDFTQAELYLLTMLSRDPNNLMLAGDTAQSITVGVGFRFTDVKQIFYDEFGCNKPDLLQLTHNFRSHAGVLRLAACVVELLYFFFSDSLDRLPPDLGLFNGPRPVIMEAQSPEELVLMLEGSKRETSRIEFGAHQVVIVRSEEAKHKLPDEFGVDKDWVMTVCLICVII